jgi:para-nitrobenzyl esterase
MKLISPIAKKILLFPALTFTLTGLLTACGGDSNTSSTMPIVTNSELSSDEVPTTNSIDPTPIAPTPVNLTPIAPTPVDLTPIAPTPVDLTPIAPTPVDLTPVDLTPIAPTPVDLTPVDLTPVDLTPVDLTPVNLTPVDPTPIELPILELTFSELPTGVNVEGLRFVDNIKYGEDERQRFDFYMPESDTPTGLVMFYHGGGFRAGHESDVLTKLGADGLAMLEQGYAIASSTYRLLDGTHNDGVMRCLSDATYALQFVRYYAHSLNIDPENVVLAGTSAGASTSLWIGLQDDMADPEAIDPIKQQSTRVKAIAIDNTQSTLDIKRWQDDETILNEFNLTNEQALTLGGGAIGALHFFGIETTEANLADPLAAWEDPEIIEYRQSVDMLDFFTSDDPELFVDNKSIITIPTNTNTYLHHSYHARALQVAADAASVPGKYFYGPLNDRLYESEPKESLGEFIFRKLAE